MEKKKEDRSTAYKPDELPQEITRKMYLHYEIGGYFVGRISVYDFESSTDTDKVVLCEIETTFKLPKISRKGLKTKALGVLEREKQKIMAENHQRLAAVQNKIDNLLAIEYQPEV